MICSRIEGNRGWDDPSVVGINLDQGSPVRNDAGYTCDAEAGGNLRVP